MKFQVSSDGKGGIDVSRLDGGNDDPDELRIAFLIVYTWARLLYGKDMPPLEKPDRMLWR